MTSGVPTKASSCLGPIPGHRSLHERVKYIHAGLPEIARVPGDNSQTVHQFGCRDQAVLDRQRLSRPA
jgi:hypothetical protein